MRDLRGLIVSITAVVVVGTFVFVKGLEAPSAEAGPREFGGKQIGRVGGAPVVRIIDEGAEVICYTWKEGISCVPAP